MNIVKILWIFYISLLNSEKSDRICINLYFIENISMVSLISKDNLDSIGDVINYYNLHIFDEKIWKQKWLWKIAEVTYSYHKETWINETLFINIWNLDLEKFISVSQSEQSKLILKAKKLVEKEINKKITLINQVLFKLQESKYSKWTPADLLEREIFISAVVEKLNLLEYCLMSLEFEAEKAGLDLDLSTEEINRLESEIASIDSKLYGWLIKDNPEEVIIAYEYSYGTYLKKKWEFTHEEDIKFIEYLDKMRNYLPKNYQFIKKQKTKSIAWLYLKYELQRTDYILAFNMLIDAFWSMHHIVKSDKNAWSISDGPEGVYFPMNEKFNTITIERFFRLGMHEIETHNVTDNNSHRLLWNLRGANSTKKDEWTAILMEQLFMHGRNILSQHSLWHQFIDKSKLQINWYFSKIFMWEILSSRDFKEYLELSEIIDPDIITSEERYKRLKRNNRKWVQHKDTTYTRGLLQAVDEINTYIETNWSKWLSAEDLFIGKISFEETMKFKKLKELKKLEWIETGNLKPIFVSDAVYYIIEKKLQWLDSHINTKDFLKHLEYKYPLLDFVKDLDAKIYFRKNSRVMWIANVLLQIISNKKVENIFESVDDKQKSILEKIFQTQYQPLINDVHADLASHRRNHK